MSSDQKKEYALRESDHMRVLASQMKQLGFLAIAAHLNEQTKRALKFASGK